MTGERRPTVLETLMLGTGMHRPLAQRLFDWANLHKEQPLAVLARAVEEFLNAHPD